MKNLLLLFFTCFTTLVLVGQIPTNGLVAYYPFDGDALDYSGNRNHGTVNGATLTTDRFGNANKAYQFDGGSITGVANNFPIGSSARTISVWFKVTSNWAGGCAGRDIFVYGNKQSTSSALVFRAWTNNAVITGLEFITATNVQYILPSNFVLNEWYHLLMSYDGVTARLYLDGALVSQTTLNWSGHQSGNFSIGRSLSDVSCVNQLNGSIDDIRIYNRALTADEVKLLAKPAAYNFAKCAGDTLQLTAPSVSGVSYAWKKVNTAIGTGSLFSKPNCTVSDNAVYSLDATYKSCSFPNVDTTIVNSINPLPILNITNLNPTVCKTGNPIVLQGTPTGGTFRIDNALATTLTPSVLAAGNHVVSYAYRDANGCRDSITQAVRVNDAVTGSISKSLCRSDSVVINGKVYSIRKPSGKDTLRGASASGCDSVVNIQLVFPTPTIATDDVYSLPSGQTTLDMKVTQNDLIGQLGAVKLLKQSSNNRIEYLNNGIFRYTAVQYSGVGTVTFQYKICENACPLVCDSATVSIESLYKKTTEIPYGITPNGDGDNDTLFFDDLDQTKYPNSELVVANRWGLVLYKAKPYQNDWKGDNQSGQPLPAGTYYYIMRLSLAEGFIISGDVTIVR